MAAIRDKRKTGQKSWGLSLGLPSLPWDAIAVAWEFCGRDVVNSVAPFEHRNKINKNIFFYSHIYMFTYFSFWLLDILGVIFIPIMCIFYLPFSFIMYLFSSSLLLFSFDWDEKENNMRMTNSAWKRKKEKKRMKDITTYDNDGNTRKKIE